MSRAAGEGNATKSAKKRKRGKAALEAVDEQADDSGRSKFARALGSPDWTTREKGLQVLTRWLTHRENITDTDLNKIWKGLFYAFWHSDKQPVQVCAAPLVVCRPCLGILTAPTAADGWLVRLCAGGSGGAPGADPASAQK